MVRQKRLPPRMIWRAGRKRYYCWVFDAAGKRRWKALSSHYDVAREQQAEFERHHSLPARSVERARLRLDFIVAEYLSSLRPRVSPNHLRNVKSCLDQVLVLLAVSVASELSVAAMRRLEGDLLGSGNSNRTVNKKIGHLRAALRWAVAEELVPEEPAAGYRKLPENKHKVRRRHRPTIEEIRKIVAVARADDESQSVIFPDRVAQAPLLVALAFTGFRWGEAVSLRWSDLMQVDGRWRLVLRPGNSKTGEPRTVPIPIDVAECLLGVRRSQGRALDRLPQADDRIFLTPRGEPWGPWNRNNSLRWLDRVIKCVDGVEKVRADGSTIDWHSFRHGYAQMLRNNGVDLWTAQSLLGHRDPKLTAQIYSEGEPAASPKDAAVDRLPGLHPPQAGGEPNSSPASI